MTTIKSIDRRALETIRAAAMPAVAAALAPLGITIKPGRSKFSNGSTGTLVIELALAGVDTEREDFERYAPLFEFLGLKPEDYGRAFDFNGKRYRLVGLAPGNRTFPVLAEGPDGERYKFTEDAVLRSLRMADRRPA